MVVNGTSASHRTMGESRTKKAGRNIVAAILQQLVNLALVWISRIVFVRYLDAAYLGINGLFSNIINVLSMADLGVATAMMYSLYGPIAEGKTKEIASLVSFFKKVYSVIAIAVFVFGMAFIPILPSVVNLEKPIPGLTEYYVLSVINTVLSYLFVYRTTLLTADQKNYIVSSYTIVFKILTFLAQIIILIMFKNYFLYLLISTVMGFVCNVALNGVALRYYPYLKEKVGFLEKSKRYGIWENVKSLFIYRVSGIIQTNTDSILISIMIGTVYVGYYSNYLAVVMAVTSFIGIAFSALKAGIGNLIASRESTAEREENVFLKLEFCNFWMIGFCSVCLTCLMPDFIMLSFPKEYLLSFPVTIAIVMNFYTSNIRQNIWAFREATGIFNETRYITAVTAVINLFLSIIFGVYWGLLGILSATVIARMVYAWWKEPQILFQKQFHAISVQKYYILYLIRLCIFIFTCSITWILCEMVPIQQAFYLFIVKIGICAVVPNALFLLFFWRTKEFRALLKRGKEIITFNMNNVAKND